MVLASMHLPSLKRLSLQFENKPNENVHSRMNFLFAELDPCIAPILHLSTNLASSPLMTCLIPPVFPLLTTLDLNYSVASLSPSTWHRLFDELSHLVHLSARTRKPNFSSQSDAQRAALGNDVSLVEQAELDRRFLEDEGVRKMVEKGAARDKAREEAAREIPGIPSPPPPSMRIRCLELNHVDCINGLLPLGPYFPCLTKLKHLALVASDFTRAGPCADERVGMVEAEAEVVLDVLAPFWCEFANVNPGSKIPAPGSGMMVSGSGSGKRDSRGDPLTSPRPSTLTTLGTSAAAATCGGGGGSSAQRGGIDGEGRGEYKGSASAMPCSLWLSRFPVLQELKVWLDPKDLPCVGGNHVLHIQAPFLR